MMRQAISRLILVTMVVMIIVTNIAAQTAAPRTKPIAVGEVAPDFVLKDQNGNTTQLSSFRTKMPVVLVFYRGYW